MLILFSRADSEVYLPEVEGLCPGLPERLRCRRSLVAMVTLFALIPLCLKRRFSLLRISSIAGLACTLQLVTVCSLCQDSET